MAQRSLNNVITRLTPIAKRAYGSLSEGQTLAIVVVVVILIIPAIQGGGW